MEPTVFVVDDEAAVRKSLSRTFLAAGMAFEAYESAEAFLRREDHDVPGCLLLDLEMPRLNGLDLQRELRAADIDLPVIFLTGHGTVSDSVEAMKSGAVDFIEKPYEYDKLVEVVREAFRLDRQRRLDRAERSEIQSCIDALTPRERDVFRLVVKGFLNKQIGQRLGIAEKTVKKHRGRVMDKMGVESLAELARLAERMGDV